MNKFSGDRRAIDSANAVGLFCAVAVHPTERPELLGVYATRTEADAKLTWEDVCDATSGESFGIVTGPAALPNGVRFTPPPTEDITF